MYLCPECGSEKVSTAETHLKCQGCAREYPVLFGEVPDFAPVAGFRDTVAHSYTYSYSSRFYEYFRKGLLMKISTGVSYAEEKQRLFDGLKLENGLAVLDIGCGTGFYSRRFARAVPSLDVHGLDYSYSQLRQAVAYKKQSGLKNLHFAHGTASKLPFAAVSFDRVATVGAMQFFGGMEHFLGEVNRVLKPGGRFFAVNYLSIEYKPADSVPARLAQKTARNHGDHFFSRQELLGLSAGAGFTDIDFSEKGITFFLGANKPC